MRAHDIGILFINVMLAAYRPLPAAAQTSAPLSNPAPQSTGMPAGNVAPASRNSMVEQEPQNLSSNFETPPLIGAKEFGPGFTTEAISYMIPSFQYTAFVDTDPGNVASREGPILQNSYVGSLTLQRVTPNAQFNLNYEGGAQVYNRSLNSVGTDSQSSYGTFHQVSLGASIDWQRWKLFVGDQGSYLPESPLGFNGFGGLTSFNAGLGGQALWNGGTLNDLLQPQQSILSPFAHRVSNTSVGQVEYAATPRTTYSVTGAHGLLNFLDPGFTDNDYDSLLANMTHTLGPGTYVGVTYLHSRIHFHAPYQDILDRGPILSYGRRILGKASLEVSVGYLLHQFARPTGGSISQGFVTTYDSLNYRWQRNDFKVSFNRSISGGSGVLRGAETNFVEGHIGRKFFRSSYVELSFGHVYNQSLTQVNTAANLAKAETWESRTRLSRELGPHLSFYIEYSVQRQVANASLCIADSCGASFLRQVGGVGLNWHTRPIRLR